MDRPSKIFCSDIAREHSVPLVGTATRGDLWFLLEYNARWGSKAFEESTIPNAVKDFLRSGDKNGLAPRILLIRRGKSNRKKGLRFFIGQTDPQNPKLYEYTLQTYTDILNIDLSSFAPGLTGDPTHLRKEPLFLVCTNGKRDQCCSRYGPAIYQAMKEEANHTVWQSSHIGGHNLAPNTLFFPFGVNYGQTTPDDMRHLIREYQHGRVGLDYYRGRVCYDSHVQAAEQFWRQQTGNLDLPGMKINSIEMVGENEWQIDIQGSDGSNPIRLHIQRQESDFEIPITCALNKTRSISSFLWVNKEHLSS